MFCIPILPDVVSSCFTVKTMWVELGIINSRISCLFS